MNACPDDPSLDRHVLPVRRLAPRVAAEVDRRHQQDPFPGVEQVRPPESAPNILLVMLDDVGFGTSSAFGGPTASRSGRDASP
ncbi:hypothetical protein [Dietzia cinnamea]|uniref:Sulfatase-like protein n=1 Tax=Dietzia cinnamea TaxID=321318 RepID=A0A4R3ZS97_9ACTN|nr:hypothetical protein [Dietzia cinnamea]TCW23109.1 hypothetical protein EDD19_11536 [Dietzia cinnamea]